MVANEIETKNLLEKLLRTCVDDVKGEISKKKAEKNTSYCKFPLISITFADTKIKRRDEDRNLTQQECDKIIEVLLSQERVLTLLYDKTFPPRPQSQANKPGF